MKRCSDTHTGLGYCGSWGNHPTLRENKEMSKLIRELIYCTHMNWQIENKIPEMLIGGVVRFKTDQFQESVGYTKLQENGKILNSFKHHEFFEEPLNMLYLKSFTDICKQYAKKHQNYWESRYIIETPNNYQNLKKVA
jgi:hypothetical protein